VCVWGEGGNSVPRESVVKLIELILEETWKEIDASFVSKIHVHFTQIYQGAAKLRQKLKYTCEHIRFGNKKHRS